MFCPICNKNMENAHIRECELDVASITGRAHIDCDGHSAYFHVYKKEVADAIERRNRGITPTEVTNEQK